MVAVPTSTVQGKASICLPVMLAVPIHDDDEGLDFISWLPSLHPSSFTAFLTLWLGAPWIAASCPVPRDVPVRAPQDLRKVSIIIYATAIERRGKEGIDFLWKECCSVFVPVASTSTIHAAI